MSNNKLQQVYEGWRNKLVPPEELKEIINSTVVERMAICEGCPNHSKNKPTLRPDVHCLACGCTLSAKVACLTCECPINEWAAVLTNDDELKNLEDHGEE